METLNLVRLRNKQFQEKDFINSSTLILYIDGRTVEVIHKNNIILSNSLDNWKRTNKTIKTENININISIVDLEGKREIIFEDYRFIPVASIIEINKDTYYFEYKNNWKGITLDPSLPLDFFGILNDWQIDGFLDRLPQPKNPNYKIFCQKWGISPDETDLLTRLCTLGHRTTSFTTCSPVNFSPGNWELARKIIKEKRDKKNE